MLNDVKIPPAQDPVAPAAAPPPVPSTVPGIPANARGRVLVDGVTDAAHIPKEPGVRPHEHIHPHIDPKEPGIHHARIMGEKTKIDPIYAMPMEDRGSFFSLMLSAVVVLIVGILLLVVWFSVY